MSSEATFTKEFLDDMLRHHSEQYEGYSQVERILALQGIVNVVTRGPRTQPFSSPSIPEDSIPAREFSPEIDTEYPDDLVYLLESDEVALLPDRDRELAEDILLEIMI